MFAPEEINAMPTEFDKCRDALLSDLRRADTRAATQHEFHYDEKLDGSRRWGAWVAATSGIARAVLLVGERIAVALETDRGGMSFAEAERMRKAGRDLTIHQILAHVEDELGYEDGEPSTERPGRWTFTHGAAALSEIRTWLLALLCLALALVGCAPTVTPGGGGASSGGAAGSGGASAAGSVSSTSSGGAGGGTPTWSGIPCDPCKTAAGGAGGGS